MQGSFHAGRDVLSQARGMSWWRQPWWRSPGSRDKAVTAACSWRALGMRRAQSCHHHLLHFPSSSPSVGSVAAEAPRADMKWGALEASVLPGMWGGCARFSRHGCVLGYTCILSASKIQAFWTSNKELKLLKHLLLLQPEAPHGARWADSPDQYGWFAKLLLRLSKSQSFHHALPCCWQSRPACWECCWKAIFLILTLSSPFQILYCPSSYLIQNKLLPFCFLRPLWCFSSYLP